MLRRVDRMKLALVLLLVLAAKADTTFPFFYGCDSGKVNCNTMFENSHPYDGSFGLDVVTPTGCNTVGATELVMSNQNGLVLGYMYSGGSDPVPLIGEGGISCYGGYSDGGVQWVDVNNNGEVVANYGNVSPSRAFLLMGVNGDPVSESLPNGVLQSGEDVVDTRNIAIDDSGQILFLVDTNERSIVGVLSPMAVGVGTLSSMVDPIPEPGAWVLLVIGLGGLWLKRSQ